MTFSRAFPLRIFVGREMHFPPARLNLFLVANNMEMARPMPDLRL
jgi:hypothetical protein